MLERLPSLLNLRSQRDAKTLSENASPTIRMIAMMFMKPISHHTYEVIMEGMVLDRQRPLLNNRQGSSKSN